MKKIFFVLILFIPLFISAQTIKTGVIVIGNGNGAFAAGVQSSESGVNTTVLTQSDGFELSNLNTPNQNGVTLTFIKRFRKSLKLADSVPLPNLNRQMANAVIKNWSDSSKLFNVINNISYTQVKRTGNSWELKLSDGKYLKAKILVLAEPAENLLKALKINAIKPSITNDIDYRNNLYRTSISGLNTHNRAQFLSLYKLLIPNQENLVYITGDNLEIGQATGATAAYAAFFETKTSLSNLKEIQKELLKYKGAILPLDDVKIRDSSWLAIQKIATTGILKAELKDGKLFFNPNELVTYNEIKQPLKDYFYKAQLWFDDHLDAVMNLENTISLVANVGNKSVDATKASLEKDWNKTYKFESKYDLKRLLTRKEFAVIINTYLKPFDEIKVDKTGRILR